MKRKFSEISKESSLTIYKPITLPCDICNAPVNYELCCGNCIYCSLDCYEVIYLSNINDYIDVKKVKSFENLAE